MHDIHSRMRRMVAREFAKWENKVLPSSMWDYFSNQPQVWWCDHQSCLSYLFHTTMKYLDLHIIDLGAKWEISIHSHHLGEYYSNFITFSRQSQINLLIILCISTIAFYHFFSQCSVTTLHTESTHNAIRKRGQKCLDINNTIFLW